ncbi:MAG: hypothetical protein JNL21_02655 [Myxococcales bacterium]|nr:hypothetical protein [Myxococcales bacterium]
MDDHRANPCSREQAEQRLARNALLGALTGRRTARAASVAELVAHLEQAEAPTLAGCLMQFAGRDEQRKSTLLHAIGAAARQLAPDDRAPSRGAAAAAWRALVETSDQLQGSGVVALGRLPFVDDSLLERLRDEASRMRPRRSSRKRRSVGAAGPVLESLACSRHLRRAVAHALGVSVELTYHAVYELDPPSSTIGIHLDAPGYPFVYHLLVDQTHPPGRAPRSTLVAHLPESRRPERVRVRPGESIVLRGRGTLHSWDALPDDQHRVLVAIGFGPVVRP